MNTLFLKKIDQIAGKFFVTLFFSPVDYSVDYSSPLRVLIIRPGGIGDAVLLIPAILSLKEKYPHCQIDILAEKRNAQIFSLCPKIYRVYCYDDFSDLFSVLKTQYDVVIDTEQWHRLSAVIARLIRSKSKIGFGTNERAKMFTTAVPYSHETYEALSFFDLVQSLKVNPPSSSTAPFLVIPASANKASQLLSADMGKYVVLFPGASIQERRWNIDCFSALADKLIGQKLKVVIVGGGEDCSAGKRISGLVEGVINLTGKTSLLETAAIINSAALLVSGDSGVLHIGVGLGIPTVSLFGPGIAKKWAPQGLSHRVINLELSCSPCTQFGTTPVCPIGAKCIQDISVERVFSAARELLNQ